MAVASGFADLRSQLEGTALDSTLDPDERARFLDEFRDRLNDLLGLTDTYLGSVNKVRDARAMVATAELRAVRENADVREQLIVRGVATVDQLDDAGMLSHEELDMLSEEGLLLDAAPRLAARLEEAVGPFRANLHPRDRRGRWSETDGVAHLRKVKSSLSVIKTEQQGNVGPGAQFPGVGIGPKTYDSDIAAITDWQDATRLLKAAGIKDVRLEPPQGSTVAALDSSRRTDLLRQIAQVTRDQTKAHPELLTGTGDYSAALTGVGWTQSFGFDVSTDMKDDVWAVTGDPTGDHIDAASNLPLPAEPGAPMAILINSENKDVDSNNWSDATDGNLAVSDINSYGRLTHEFGHALWWASGNAFSHHPVDWDGERDFIGGNRLYEAMNHAGLTPNEVTRYSRYAAANLDEAFAETYSLIHTPGALEAAAKGNADLPLMLRRAAVKFNDKAGGKFL